jgi:hypothetical protein
VAGEIANHFSAAGGMADMDRIFQIKMRGNRSEVIGVVIQIVAVADLCRAAVAAAIVGNHAIAVIEEEQHLRVPIVGRERPAMTEDDGLTFAPVLIENINTIFGLDEAHMSLPTKSSALSNASKVFGTKVASLSSVGVIGTFV